MPERLLVAKVHGLGDAVLIRSIIDHLRVRNPSLKIGVLAGDATYEVLTMQSDFRLHHYRQMRNGVYSSLRLLDEIKRCGYEAAICFEQGSVAGTGFLRATSIPRRVGFIPQRNSAKGSLLTHGLVFQSGASMWQSFLSLARMIDPRLPNTLSPFPLSIPREQLKLAASWLDKRIAKPSGRKVCFHLGSGPGQSFKRWPVASFAELARELRSRDGNVSIILTGKPDEDELFRQFSCEYDGATIDASALGSVAMTASILCQCDLLISNDTGVMHLGAAVGIPTVGLFGATTPAQWAPVGPRATHVYATKLNCSPCVDSYRNRVPTQCTNPDYAGCMGDIKTEAVLIAARRVAIDDWLN
jgi:lipopolysaccharide heptosyltransferase II